MSSRLARDDWEDLSARSGGSGPWALAPVLPLLFSSLVWDGWLRLGMPSPPAWTEPDDGFSATQTTTKIKKRLNRYINKISLSGLCCS